MNRRGLIGITLALLLTISSTAIVAFASKNSASSTKNVVRVLSTSDKRGSLSKGAAAKIKTDTKKATKKDKLSKKSQSNKNVDNKKISTNVTSENLKKDSKNNSSSNSKLLNITDEKAIEIAKDAIKYYTGVDMEKLINADGLKADIIRNNDETYAWGPDILVSFDNDKHNDNIFASISTTDGKVYNVTAMVGSYSEKKINVNENKVKDAALTFLKDKGFGSDVRSITVDDEKTSIGIIGAKCLYDDGTEILIEFNGEDNSVINFTHYNLKTMKFASN